MKIKLHPLVQKSKIELERLDKLNNVSWEEKRKFYSAYLPISVEPKLRKRALRFMDALVKKLEENNHRVQFECGRCHIEMYDQLTEIFLRQKYFRKRIKDSSGYGTDTYEKSDKLEFQVGSFARKGWIDKKTKSLEDYLPAIYDYIEKDSERWAKWRKHQKIEEEKREAKKKIEEEIAKQKAIDEEKVNKLIEDSQNHNTANIIRAYLNAYRANFKTSEPVDVELEEYLEWAYKKANEIDPLS